MIKVYLTFLIQKNTRFSPGVFIGYLMNLVVVAVIIMIVVMIIISVIVAI